MRMKSLWLAGASLALSAFAMFPPVTLAQSRHNVIIFVADGLRRGSVTPEDMPTLYKLRTNGVDFRNSHSVFPTFTTANASVIATGHGLGDTGDYSNTIFPGAWLTKPVKPDVAPSTGWLVPFLENDETLTDMNSMFGGNYLGERTLLSVARDKGFNVAAIGKLGPAAIQLNDVLHWDEFDQISSNDALIVDDSTGHTGGVPLSVDWSQALFKAGLPLEAPLRTNGYDEKSMWSNGFSGDAITAGTLDSNRVQEKWFADVATEVVLPKFVADAKPFVMLFWSRDPDGTQHNEGDSLQRLTPGINGETSKRGLQNADRCLKQLLDWLDAHPALKATTDIVVTSDHGFATISRREIANGNVMTGEPSAALPYELNGAEKAQPQGTLPTGFLAIDLAIRGHMRLYDPGVRVTGGVSVYQELKLSGEKAQHSASGSALLGDTVKTIDGSDAQLVLASNGGSDLIYVPGKNAALVHQTVDLLTQLDYVGGIFVDDAYCASPTDCPGALPMSKIGLIGKSNVPRPAIAVTFKVFYGKPGDLQSAAQVSDTTLQEGQGMHGGFGRDQTFNNMAAIGPDFKTGFADEAPMGNVDIVPTLAKILGLDMPSNGSLKGRVLQEALKDGEASRAGVVKTLVSAPGRGGVRTLMEYQEAGGVVYNDRACVVTDAKATRCP